MSKGRRLNAGRYGYRDILCGDKIATGSCIVTAEMIDAFAALTGDRFEIHTSDAAARRHGFAGRVAHGLLVLSLVDGLKNEASAILRAQASLGWEWYFSAPVLIDDRLSADITVTKIRPVANGGRAVVTLFFDVTNLHGVTVQRGLNRLMVYA